ncbi:hypothetical protein PV797_05425 [Clostridiaceae bacterium M8S5]|nr:hypothetical protein PV797_05425 [Clostridiaceae bacterium M8S5]
MSSEVEKKLKARSDTINEQSIAGKNSIAEQPRYFKDGVDDFVNLYTQNARFKYFFREVHSAPKSVYNMNAEVYTHKINNQIEKRRKLLSEKARIDNKIKNANSYAEEKLLKKDLENIQQKIRSNKSMTRELSSNKVKGKPVNSFYKKMMNRARKFNSKLWKNYNIYKAWAITGVENFVDKSIKKIPYIGEKILSGGKYLGKNLQKILPGVDIGVNSYVLATDPSNFKRSLAGLDMLGYAGFLAGPEVGVPVKAITGYLNFFGALGYDIASSFDSTRFIAEWLDDNSPDIKSVTDKYITPENIIGISAAANMAMPGALDAGIWIAKQMENNGLDSQAMKKNIAKTDSIPEIINQSKTTPKLKTPKKTTIKNSKATINPSNITEFNGKYYYHEKPLPKIDLSNISPKQDSIDFRGINIPKLPPKELKEIPIKQPIPRLKRRYDRLEPLKMTPIKLNNNLKPYIMPYDSSNINIYNKKDGKGRPGFLKRLFGTSNKNKSTNNTSNNNSNRNSIILNVNGANLSTDQIVNEIVTNLNIAMGNTA